MTSTDVLLRLAVAVTVTFLIGLERSRRIPSIGGRTFGMIGLAGATAAILAAQQAGGDPNVVSRVLQGALMGVGFVGAGVIMHPSCRRGLHGVTTAAAIWVAALVGFAAGLGNWILLAGGAGLAMLLLVAPEPFQRRDGRKDEAVRPGGSPPD